MQETARRVARLLVPNYDEGLRIMPLPVPREAIEARILSDASDPENHQFLYEDGDLFPSFLGGLEELCRGPQSATAGPPS